MHFQLREGGPVASAQRGAVSALKAKYAPMPVMPVKDTKGIMEVGGQRKVAKERGVLYRAKNTECSVGKKPQLNKAIK